METALLIGKDHRITTDEQNVILSKRSIYQSGLKAGQERWEIIGYYPSHKSALHDMVRIEMLAVDQYYQTIVAKIDELHGVIEGLDHA